MESSNPKDDVVSSVIRPAADRAIKSLLRWVRFRYNDETDRPVHLILTLNTETVNSCTVNTKPYQILLPHPIKQISTTSITVLIDDSLKESSFTFPNTRVLTFSTFNSTHATPAARRDFLLSSTVLIVDGRVYHLLEKQVGERLFEKKRKRMELFQIELGDVEGRVRWKEQIERRLRTTKMKFGKEGGALVGNTTSLSSDQVVDNVVCLVNVVTKRLEMFGGLEIVKEIRVKTTDSIPLPVYRMIESIDVDDDCDDGKNMATKRKIRIGDDQKKLKVVKKRGLS